MNKLGPDVCGFYLIDPLLCKLDSCKIDKKHIDFESIKGDINESNHIDWFTGGPY